LRNRERELCFLCTFQSTDSSYTMHKFKRERLGNGRLRQFNLTYLTELKKLAKDMLGRELNALARLDSKIKLCKITKMGNVAIANFGNYKEL